MAHGSFVAKTTPLLVFSGLRAKLPGVGQVFALKELLRSVKARTSEALDQATTEALTLISADNAKAWFRLAFGSLR